MDAAVISALSGLAGAIIGGATSAASSVIGERVKDGRKAEEVSWNRRARLYNDFIGEAAREFADAFAHDRDDPSVLVPLYALVARMRLIAPDTVVAAAEAATINVHKAYEAPIQSLRDIHLYSEDGGIDPLLDFSQACRDDLEITRANLLRQWRARAPS